MTSPLRVLVPVDVLKIPLEPDQSKAPEDPWPALSSSGLRVVGPFRLIVLPLIPVVELPLPIAIVCASAWSVWPPFKVIDVVAVRPTVLPKSADVLLVLPSVTLRAVSPPTVTLAASALRVLA